MPVNVSPVTDLQRRRFAAFLVQFLKDANINHKELERRSGMKLPYRTIRAWVSGRNLPSRDKLPLLADALQLPLETLMRRSGMVADDGTDPDAETEAVMTMVKKIMKEKPNLEAVTWETFIAMVEGFAKMAHDVSDISKRHSDQAPDFPDPTWIVDGKRPSRPGARPRQCKPKEDDVSKPRINDDLDIKPRTPLRN